LLQAPDEVAGAQLAYAWGIPLVIGVAPQLVRDLRDRVLDLVADAREPAGADRWRSRGLRHAGRVTPGKPVEVIFEHVSPCLGIITPVAGEPEELRQHLARVAQNIGVERESGLVSPMRLHVGPE